jgi:hypothetical protein
MGASTKFNHQEPKSAGSFSPIPGSTLKSRTTGKVPAPVQIGASTELSIWESESGGPVLPLLVLALGSQTTDEVPAPV